MLTLHAPSILEALYEPLLQNRIKACRLARDRTQQYVADQVGMNRVSIAMIETGRARPSLDSFFELARVLDVDPSALYHGVGR